MSITEAYREICVFELPGWVQAHKCEGWRFVQLLAVNTENGVDLLYTLRKDDVLEGAAIRGIGEDDHVPSITTWYLAAFVFENEIHDLFGVKVDGIAIDFHGAFYKVAVDKPMTVVTPEQLAIRKKAAKAAEKLAAAKSKREAHCAGVAVDAPPADSCAEGRTSRASAAGGEAKPAGSAREEGE